MWKGFISSKVPGKCKVTLVYNEPVGLTLAQKELATYLEEQSINISNVSRSIRITL